MVEASLARRCASELVGTALLVFVGAGSVAAGGSLGVVALAFGFVVVACVYVLGPISGSHINPPVTVAFAATRRFPSREVPAYVAAQFAGAAVGALLMWGSSARAGRRSGPASGWRGSTKRR